MEIGVMVIKDVQYHVRWVVRKRSENGSADIASIFILMMRRSYVIYAAGGIEKVRIEFKRGMED